MNRRHFSKTIIGGILSAPFVNIFASKVNTLSKTDTNTYNLFTKFDITYYNHQLCVLPNEDCIDFECKLSGSKKYILDELDHLFEFFDSDGFEHCKLSTYIILSNEDNLPENFKPASFVLEGDSMKELKKKYLIQFDVILNHSDFMRDHNQIKQPYLINNFVGGGANS